MSGRFAQEWPKTQHRFRACVSNEKWRPAWDSLMEGLSTASVRGHKSSATGNHVDIRINWFGKVRRLHIDARHFEGPYVAQYVLGALVVEVMPGASDLIEQCYQSAKASGNFEFAMSPGISVAEVLYDEAEKRGLGFCRDLVEYAERARSSPLDAKRKHAREMALGEAKKHIKIAIQNGLSPDDVIDFVNQCVVEEVLSS